MFSALPCVVKSFLSRRVVPLGRNTVCDSGHLKRFCRIRRVSDPWSPQSISARATIAVGPPDS